MKATGIVRRIDDLGRVVIPKEIRRTMRIREGQAMEIYTGREGEIVLKKYSPVEELAECAAALAKSISSVTGLLVCISDLDQIICTSGPTRKNTQERKSVRIWSRRFPSGALFCKNPKKNRIFPLSRSLWIPVR